MTLVVNFFAGPGSGKSTMAAALFAELKTRGVNCELATEYAKGKVWEQSYGVFDDQIYVFAKQNHRIRVMLGKVQVVITDAPVLLSLYYGPDESEQFKELVIREHNIVPSLNILLRRVKKYNPNGRRQSEESARKIDVDLKRILDDHLVTYLPLDGDTAGIPNLAGRVMKILREETEDQDRCGSGGCGHAPHSTHVGPDGPHPDECAAGCVRCADVSARLTLG